MSIWSAILDFLRDLGTWTGLSQLFERSQTPPERSITFTIAVIALGAKLAKADGQVTRNEVAAFREVFTIPETERANAARVFDLARQDVTGFDTYARQVAGMFAPNDPVLVDLLEGLFYIAAADGTYDPAEDAFLQEVARIFGISARAFTALRNRFATDVDMCGYSALGLPPDATYAEARAAWRQLVKENHPDRLAAKGLPSEAMAMAQKRLIAINKAWECIKEQHKLDVS